MPRDEPNTSIVTKKIEVTKVTYKGIDRKNKKLYTRDMILHGTFKTREEELELVRKQINGKTDLALTIVNEEKGLATFSMPRSEFLAKAHKRNEKEITK